LSRRCQTTVRDQRARTGVAGGSGDLNPNVLCRNEQKLRIKPRLKRRGRGSKSGMPPHDDATLQHEAPLSPLPLRFDRAMLVRSSVASVQSYTISGAKQEREKPPRHRESFGRPCGSWIARPERLAGELRQFREHLVDGRVVDQGGPVSRLRNWHALLLQARASASTGAGR
jgi:hypothetical protein